MGMRERGKTAAPRHADGDLEGAAQSRVVRPLCVLSRQVNAERDLSVADLCSIPGRVASLPMSLNRRSAAAEVKGISSRGM